MSVLAECRFCKRKQSLRNKICKCGENLDKQKRSKQIKYWMQGADSDIDTAEILIELLFVHRGPEIFSCHDIFAFQCF